MNLATFLIWTFLGAIGWVVLIFRWNGGKTELPKDMGFALVSYVICAGFGPIAAAYAAYLVVGDWIRARRAGK